jgi:hypothetical protein
VSDSGLDSPLFREPVGEELKLLAELVRAGQLDPVPPELTAAAKSSFAWYTMDAELAALVYDSSEDDRELAGVRGASSTRLLTFESPALTVEVEATADGNRRRLLGQLVPPQPGRVEVRHIEGSASADVDEVGRFAVDDVPPGPVSLHCQGSGDSVAVTTDWVLV